jgi:hypothetical protein
VIVSQSFSGWRFVLRVRALLRGPEFATHSPLSCRINPPNVPPQMPLTVAVAVGVVASGILMSLVGSFSYRSRRGVREESRVGLALIAALLLGLTALYLVIRMGA